MAWWLSSEPEKIRHKLHLRATQTTNDDDDMDQEELQKPAKDHKYCHCRNHEANERESSNPSTYIGNNTRVQPPRRRKTGPLSIEKIAEIITINLSDQRMDFFVVLFFSSATEVSQRNFLLPLLSLVILLIYCKRVKNEINFRFQQREKRT